MLLKEAQPMILKAWFALRTAASYVTEWAWDGARVWLCVLIGTFLSYIYLKNVRVTKKNQRALLEQKCLGSTYKYHKARTYRELRSFSISSWDIDTADPRGRYVSANWTRGQACVEVLRAASVLQVNTYGAPSCAWL